MSLCENSIILQGAIKKAVVRYRVSETMLDRTPEIDQDMTSLMDHLPEVADGKV